MERKEQCSAVGKESVPSNSILHRLVLLTLQKFYILASWE